MINPFLFVVFLTPNVAPSGGDCNPGGAQRSRRPRRSGSGGPRMGASPASCRGLRGHLTGVGVGVGAGRGDLPAPPAASGFREPGRWRELSRILSGPLLKFRRPPFAAPWGAAYSVTSPKIRAAVRAELGLPRRLQSGGRGERRTRERRPDAPSGWRRPRSRRGLGRRSRRPRGLRAGLEPVPAAPPGRPPRLGLSETRRWPARPAAPEPEGAPPFAPWWRRGPATKSTAAE